MSNSFRRVFLLVEYSGHSTLASIELMFLGIVMFTIVTARSN